MPIASQTRPLHAPTTRRSAHAQTAEAGQASVEYALVLLGAALVASLLIAWATKTDLLDQLFDHVLNLIKGKAR
jgi:Flp pilus assembly pilin Flp